MGGCGAIWWNMAEGLSAAGQDVSTFPRQVEEFSEGQTRKRWLSGTARDAEPLEQQCPERRMRE